VKEDHIENGQEQAMFYALGALEPAEVAVFERHISDGCKSCEDELKTFQAAATGFAYAVPQQTPDDNVRRRLMALVNEGTGLTTLRAEPDSWQESGFEGIQVRRLFVDRERSTVSMLVRMAAGARYPRHRHAAVEEVYMIEGDLHVSGTVLLAGDYQRADLDSFHGAQWTEKGCTAFIIASFENELF